MLSQNMLRSTGNDKHRGKMIHMAFLVLVRHGQSQLNMENRFSGWIDTPLSKTGKQEAHECAKRVSGFEFDAAYTSDMVRSKETLDIILKDIDQCNVPITVSRTINERMYGNLQGKNKDEVRRIYGKEQVRIWRRSYDARPPGGESLADTAARALPFFKKRILADVKKGKNILVVAHGNSLRSIIMCLDKLTKKDVMELNISTGVPYVYEIDGRGHVKGKEILRKQNKDNF